MLWEIVVEEGVKGRPKEKVSEKTRSTKTAKNEGGVWCGVVVEI